MGITYAQEDAPMAMDMLVDIQTWLDGMEESLNNENISYGELAEIENVYGRITL